MATAYKYENSVPSPFSTGVDFLSSSIAVPSVGYPQRIVFNSAPRALTNTAYTTASWVNTTGAGLPSGTGKIIFDNAYNGATFYIVQPDRSSFAFYALSGTGTQTATLTANGYNAWGPTEVRLRLLEYI
jgi:hypothetical protein